MYPNNNVFNELANFQPIRREVDADNSCLFSSIAYLLDRSNFNEESSLKFRQIIINHLLDDLFDSNLLDKPKDEYIEYIANPKNWGGALEVKMFSDIFKKQIVCIDVKTNRADIFGEDKKYPQRIYLLYNGIHYDPLVMNMELSSDPATDITIFDSDDNEVFELMKCLLLEYKNQGERPGSPGPTALREFVDFYSMQCKGCNEKFKNENDALEHSLNYNHWDFKQI
jgi:ubiquitin thioesterase OTU1